VDLILRMPIQVRVATQRQTISQKTRHRNAKCRNASLFQPAKLEVLTNYNSSYVMSVCLGACVLQRNQLIKDTYLDLKIKISVTVKRRQASYGPIRITDASISQWLRTHLPLMKAASSSTRWLWVSNHHNELVNHSQHRKPCHRIKTGLVPHSVFRCMSMYDISWRRGSRSNTNHFTVMICLQ